MASHTVLIAQSGSGKSALLGRLMEELLTQTRARCLVLDPNSDFRRAHELKPEGLWKEAGYDPATRRGLLPHESTRTQFQKAWSRVRVRILGGDSLQELGPPAEPVRLWWPSLSVDFLAEDLTPIERSELFHCHAYLRAIADLSRIREKEGEKSFYALDVAETLYTEASAGSPSAEKLRERLERGLRKAYSIDELTEHALGRVVRGFRDVLPFSSLLGALPALSQKDRESTLRSRIRARLDRASTALNYVSPGIIRFYFGKAREYQTAGILAGRPPEESPTGTRLHVLDLPSLPTRDTRLLVLNATLTGVWNRARSEWSLALERDATEDTRVPTFVVLEEAHNLVPAEPQDRREGALRSQFRKIVAEGRKYGLFLILVSQRPDKLDPLVLSECENKAIMRLDSRAVLDRTRDALGLETVPEDLLEQTLEFGIGRALLVGKWAPDGPRILYGAARRTVEGGRGLRAEYWAGAP